MRLLLDSHVILWWSMGSSRLGARAREIIIAGDSELFMSAASWWELGIKHALGKLDIDMAAVRGDLEHRGVGFVPVTIVHAEAAAKLKVVNRDPFDHMLVTQAQVEGLQLLTREKRLKDYGRSVLVV